MARRLITEESVTKCLLNWLVGLGWDIVAFDFPQSGTGLVLHPDEANRSAGTKNQGAIIPDIIARKAGRFVFFENKDRFVAEDFAKLHAIKASGSHGKAIARLAGPNVPCFFGIGLPLALPHPLRLQTCVATVDFVVGLNSLKIPFVYSDPHSLFGT